MAETAKGVSSETVLGVVEAPRESGPTPATLLLIVGEPFNIDQKDLILERIVTELLGWDSELAKCDVDEQLGAFARQQPKACDGPNGEKIFNLESAQLRVTVLLNARVQTVRDHVHSFLLARSVYRHLLYSGLALHGSGCWILQDGIFSYSFLSELFRRPDVAEAVKRAPGATIDISVLSEGDRWKEETLKHLVPNLKIRVNPPKNQKNEEGVIQFTDILSISLKAPSSVELLPATDVVGSLAFQRPTLYIFPSGSGDCTFFGVGGFNLLINGGYGRRSCFWPLVRHLQRIDAVLVSHIGPENIFGISSLFERKAVESAAPDLGMVYLNIGGTKPVEPNGALPVSTGLLVSLADEGASIVDHLRHIGMSVHPCIGSLAGQTLQSFNLYFKVGYGSLDLYILNPLKGKELQDFLGSWARNINNAKNGAPLSDEQSVCSLLVWKPASAEEKVVRILFPGNTPQSKILDGIDKLKNVASFQSAAGVSEKPEGKVVDRKPPPGAGKPSSGRQVAPPVETEHKKPAEVEQKASVVEQKDLKKSTEHREMKRPADSKPPGKGGSEAKPKSEPKEQKLPGKSIPQAKRIEGKPGTSEHKEGKASGKPDVDTKKTDSKSNHREAKSLGKQDVEAKKVDVKKSTEPKEGKKVPGSEQKDLKRASAVTHAAAVETKELKTPVARHDPAPSKVSSKVTEKAAKDAKNTKVVKETQDKKTPAKKGAVLRDFPMPSVGKEHKQQEPTVEVKKGHETEKPAPSASVDVGEIQPGLDSVEIRNAAAEEERVKSEAKEPSVVSGAEVKVGDNQGLEQLEKLPEAFAADQVKEEEEERLAFAPEVKAGIEQELQNILDQPGPTQTELDPVIPDLPVVEKSLLSMDSDGAEEDIADKSLSLLEKLSREPTDKTEPELSHSAPEVVDFLSAAKLPKESEPLLDHFASEVIAKSEPLLDYSVSKEEVVEIPEPEKVVEEAEPSLDHIASREENSVVEPHSDAGEVVDDERSMHYIHSLSKEIVKNAISSAVRSHSSEVGESPEIPEKIQGFEVEPSDLEEPVHKVSDVLISPEEPTTDSQSSLVEKDLLESLEKEMVEAPSDKCDSDLDVGKFIEKDKIEEEISAKSSKAESHFAAGERGVADDPEDVNFQETGKYQPETGEGEKTEVGKDERSSDLHKNRQKESEWIPMEKEDGLPPVAEHLLEDPDEEENFDEGDRSHEDVQVSINEEEPFDPQAKWGQPEGLPAPLNGRKENDEKKDNQSVLHTAASSSKKPVSQAASGKKNDGKDGSKRASAAAEHPAKKSGDEGTKLASGRRGSASGTQKKGRASEASFRESSTKTSHAPEAKKTAAKSIVPLHVDLAYVPCHGDTRRFDADFFRAVRARYYVLSSSEPDPEALSLLLDAKESWATHADETTVIPTYDSTRLASWIAVNQERLNRLRVVVAPSANRSTVQLKEHEANCQAYRLEF